MISEVLFKWVATEAPECCDWLKIMITSVNQYSVLKNQISISFMLEKTEFGPLKTLESNRWNYFQSGIIFTINQIITI